MLGKRRENGASFRSVAPRTAFAVVTAAIFLPSLCRAEGPTRAEAAEALHRAVYFLQAQVSRHGGYLWRYSGDLTLREAEGQAGLDTIWVQPPGTPAVGEAFLDAYEATGERLHLDAARAATDALLLGQLHSGGWHYRIEFARGERAKADYRCDLTGRQTVAPVSRSDRAGPQGWHVWKRRKYQGNITILDDDTTQAALRFLMRMDRLLAFKDERLHEAVRYGLASSLNGQYPNGAWSHNYDRYPVNPPDAQRYPVRQASYPASWPAQWPKSFEGCYAINDAITPRMITTMLRGWEVYGDKRYLQAARKGGDFLLLAQMPEPQPAWAQQYDPNMNPVWDRAFEPPAVSGRESQTVMETLLLLCRTTGDRKYLEPIPRALDYLRRSRLPDGRLARFYELKTNRPIYFTRDGSGRHRLIYRQERLADHYAFVVDSRLDAIEAAYRQLQQNAGVSAAVPETRVDTSRTRIAGIIRNMDPRGAWVEEGRLMHHKVTPEAGIIDCQTFIDNVAALSVFIRTNRATIDERGPPNPAHRSGSAQSRIGEDR